jgi:hypothetical protein
MLMVASAVQGQQALAAGELACPGCAAALRPWAWTKPRRVRGRDARIELTRLRRGPLPSLLGQPRPAPGRLAAPAPR